MIHPTLPERLEYERLLEAGEPIFKRLERLLRLEQHRALTPKETRELAEADAANSESHRRIMDAKHAMYRAEEAARELERQGSKALRRGHS